MCKSTENCLIMTAESRPALFSSLLGAPQALLHGYEAKSCSSSLIWLVAGARWGEWCLFNKSRTTSADVVLVPLASTVPTEQECSLHIQQGQILVLTDASAKSNSINQRSERCSVPERPGFGPAAMFISADVLHSAGCTASRAVITVYVPVIRSTSTFS